jgi:hypothetical protein
MPRWPRQQGKAVSLIKSEAEDAADRRLHKNAATTDAAPDDNDDPIDTQGKSLVQIMAHVINATGVAVFNVYWWSSVSEKWYLDTSLGTAGDVTVNQTDGPTVFYAEPKGMDGMYLRLKTNTNPGDANEGVNSWVAAVGELEPG